ncbi:MAG: ribulose-phosphate 3-epimerase, partial [Candidatus Eisenbacteria bacterium]|nr:ribulose-phosphate 3-epimerase [Candidatus Eisenbacteria bacterium]
MVGSGEPRSAEGGREAFRWDALRGERIVLPSLLSADFTQLGREIERMAAAGARALHLDVMDGHFVPNITFGPPLVRTVRRNTPLWLDVHLMIEQPLRYLEAFARAGADGVTVHVEANPDFAALREECDRLGTRLGLAIRPDTPVGPTLRRHGEAFDLILVMTVMPGFGGQEYKEGSAGRIREAAEIAASLPRRPVIEVDGGIKPGTIEDAAGGGAAWFVAGNAVFGAADPVEAFRDLSAR